MATIQELSDRCGVSVSTVSKALNGYTDISDRTRERVINIAREMGYIPNGNGRTLKQKQTYNIGVLFNTYTNLGFKNEYFAHVLSAFKDEASLKGYDITFIQQHIGRRKMTYLEHCQYRRLDGVCIVCTDFEDEEVLKLVNSDIPVITIDYAFQKAYSIISDNYGGMKQLTNFIIHQGHKEVAFIHGVKTLVAKNRIEGFLDAMEENKIKVPKEYIQESLYRNSLMAEEIAIKLLKRKNRPTCIIAPDDQSAMGVVSAIRKHGLQAIKDISVAGYDGVDEQLFVGMKLTTVKQEREEIGKEAAKKLIQMMEHNTEVARDTVFVKQTLIIGNSVRKIN